MTHAAESKGPKTKVYYSSNFRHAFPQAIPISLFVVPSIPYASEGKLCSVTATIEYRIMLIEENHPLLPCINVKYHFNGMTVLLLVEYLR